MVGKLDEISHFHTYEMIYPYFKDKKDKVGIDFEEFMKISKNIPMLQHQDKETLLRTFNRIDLDESGDLNIGEFRKFYSDLNVRWKAKQFEPYPGKSLQQLTGARFVKKYL